MRRAMRGRSTRERVERKQRRVQVRVRVLVEGGFGEASFERSEYQRERERARKESGRVEKCT